MECLHEEACAYVSAFDSLSGGFGTNENGASPCAAGYGENLCHACVEHGGDVYERLTSSTCSRCPEPTLNALKVMGIGLVVILYVVLLI